MAKPRIGRVGLLVPFSLVLLILVTVPACAEDTVDIYVGRDAYGHKKYITWKTNDSIDMTIGYSDSGEVSKVLFSCLEKYHVMSWGTARVDKVEYDKEADEALIKLRLEYVFNSQFMRATVTKKGSLTCHGVTSD